MTYIFKSNYFLIPGYMFYSESSASQETMTHFHPEDTYPMDSSSIE